MKKRDEPEQVELNSKIVDDLKDQINSDSLSDDSKQLLIKLLTWAMWVNRILELKSLSMKRFKRMIFGSKTEKIKKDNKDNDDDEPSGAGGSTKSKKTNKKKSGNGRTSSAKYSVTSNVDHKHESLSSGDSCPECCRGHLYNLRPSIIITFQGNQPITSKKNSVERLRCSGCGYVFTAGAAEELRKNQYNESVSTALALMRYGMGLPSKRLEEFQKIMGVPISDSMQWKLLEEAASPIFPIYQSLKRFAANADLLHHDDTYLKILDLMKENKEMTGKQRKGMHTTAFVAVKGKTRASIFVSGRNHAGENLLSMLEERNSDNRKIITMSDALSRAMPKRLDAEVCNCLSHARRKFDELMDMNISVRESKHMLKWLSVIYHNDTKAKEKNLTDQERLKYHQNFSAKSVKRIFKWCSKIKRERKEEPNSGLGGAISYMLNHWRELVKFMSVTGAPLDNNICERAIKSSIRHRKNSLFYKTQHGALIGDMFMSLIQTCKDLKINPFEYLLEIQRNKSEVFKSPENWLPWNYTTKLYC